MARINRRKWTRHEKSVHVLVSTDLATGNRPAVVSDFSKGGLRLLTRRKLTSGSTVMVRLNAMLAGLARDVRATVTWCTPAPNGGYVAGLQYEEPLYWARYE